MIGDVFTWGSNEFGQCGGSNTGEKIPIFYSPKSVNFDKYFKPVIKKISAGGYHTGFVDEIGRLFTCGKNDLG